MAAAAYLSCLDQKLRQVEPHDVAEIGRHIRGLTRRPLISIVVPVDTDDARLVTELLASLEAQLYPEWEACLGVGSADAAIAAAAIDERSRHRIRIVEAAGGGTTAALANSALSVAGGEFLLLLRARDKLAPVVSARPGPL